MNGVRKEMQFDSASMAGPPTGVEPGTVSLLPAPGLFTSVNGSGTETEIRRVREDVADDRGRPVIQGAEEKHSPIAIDRPPGMRSGKPAPLTFTRSIAVGSRRRRVYVLS